MGGDGLVTTAMSAGVSSYPYHTAPSDGSLSGQDKTSKFG